MCVKGWDDPSDVADGVPKHRDFCVQQMKIPGEESKRRGFDKEKSPVFADWGEKVGKFGKNFRIQLPE
jgi:hypothetical protein